MKYAVYMDDGAHTNQLEVFTSLKDATKAFVAEVATAKQDLAGYFGSSPDEWDEEFYPHIELSEVDDDETYVDSLNCWTNHGGFDEEPKDA